MQNGRGVGRQLLPPLRHADIARGGPIALGKSLVCDSHAFCLWTIRAAAVMAKPPFQWVLESSADGRRNRHHRMGGLVYLESIADHACGNTEIRLVKVLE